MADLGTWRRVLLLGHSYGDLVARAVLIGGARVAGLTLLDSGPAALPPGPRRAALDLAEPVLRIHGIEAVQRCREAQHGVAEPAELAALLRARFLGSSVPGLLGMATALRSEPDRVDELGPTPVPGRVRGGRRRLATGPAAGHGAAARRRR